MKKARTKLRMSACLLSIAGVAIIGLSTGVASAGLVDDVYVASTDGFTRGLNQVRITGGPTFTSVNSTSSLGFFTAVAYNEATGEVIAGTSDGNLARYDMDLGFLGFVSTGNGEISALATQSDGDILVGHANGKTGRYQSDLTFTNSGNFGVRINQIAVNPNNDEVYLVASSEGTSTDKFLAHLDSNASALLGTNVSLGFFLGVAIQSDGDVIAITSDSFVGRFDSALSFQGGLSLGVSGLTDAELAINSLDDSIYAVGNDGGTGRFLKQLNAASDTELNDGGGLGLFSALAIQSDGSVLAATTDGNLGIYDSSLAFQGFSTVASEDIVGLALNTVPEPASLALMGLGAFTLLSGRRSA